MSLGMSFARRRMVAAAKKEPKYVWAVYALEWVRDDKSVTTGSFLPYTGAQRMSAKNYTVSESGFTLVNPSSVNSLGLQTGMYFVSLHESGTNSAKSGQYLYEFTSRVSDSSRYRLSYKRYSAVRKKGTTELYRVESDTLDYPVDGEQDGLWYVLVEGAM